MAFQDLINYGAVGGAAADTNAGLGAAAKEGFLEGEERALKALERERLETERTKLAKEKERKELDADFGSLVVAPTGDTSYDASVENLAREWKSEYAALFSQKDNMDPAEFVSRKHEIMNRAKTYNEANQALANFVQMYDKAEQEGLVSDSTPANIRLLADALRNREGVDIQNVNGVPTLVGMLPGEEMINVPLSEIASGKNVFRFNQKVDTQGFTGGIAQKLQTLKGDIETENGLIRGSLPFDHPGIQSKAQQEIDNFLSNESTLRAVAADEFGINSVAFDEMGFDEVKQQVQQGLMQNLQAQYFPIQQRVADPYATQLRQQQQLGLQQRQLQLKEEEIQIQRDAAAKQKEQAAQAQAANIDFLTQLDTSDPTKAVDALRSQGITNVRYDKKHGWVITSPKDPTKVEQIVGKDGGALKTILSGGQASFAPVKRRSALKRLTSWIDSMVKE